MNMTTLTREERTALAVGMLDKWLGEHEDRSRETKVSDLLSDLHWEIRELEKTDEGRDLAIKHVRKAFNALEQEWEGRES